MSPNGRVGRLLREYMRVLDTVNTLAVPDASPGWRRRPKSVDEFPSERSETGNGADG